MRFFSSLACAAIALSMPAIALAQLQDSTIVAPETQTPPTPPSPPNVFDLGAGTLRVGLVMLMDHAAFDQDDASREQASMYTQVKLRDTRMLFNFRTKGERPIIVQTGIMFDASNQTFRYRQTGVNLPLPGNWGRLFVGRTKEGISLNKILIGTYGWTVERFTFTDATLPILADGVKWSGYLPKQNFLWNIGYYTDWQSRAETFSTYEHQTVARVAYVNMDSDTAGKLIHVGLNGRIGKPDDGDLQARSRPEAWAAPYFIDTGTFPAKSSQIAGLEAYYRNGSWLFGSEYYGMQVDAAESGDPLFHGGDIFVAWLITGETRAYNTEAGTFLGIIPYEPLSKSGSGALQASLRFSYSDFTDGTLDGGIFWRITPTVKWHLSRSVSYEFAYGYGVLDRLGMKGSTQFFQSRIQLQL